MKRRTFIKTAAATITSAWTCHVFAAVNRRDITYDPDQELKSTGLQIRDVVRILKKGEKNNVAPVLREEILDNPNAVFIIYAGIKTERDENGVLKPCPDQIERFGRRASRLVFREGTEKRGRTFIKPNLVGGLSKSRPVSYSHGGIVHPYFIAGMVDELRDRGNTNVAIGARGALRHNHVVESGFQDLLDAHKLPLIEAHVQYFKDYKRSELVWHKNPEGVVARRFCTYKPVYEKKTTFINIAHAHVHPFAHITLSVKNIMGVMPRGYGHICDAWPTLDIWRRQFMDDFNSDFRKEVEKSYIKHANMGFKYWDHGGFYTQYQSGGGYQAFIKARENYEKVRKQGDNEAREDALNKIYDIADSRLFLHEQWAQRMCDCIEALPSPYVNMVEGIFASGHDSGVVHGDFLTVGRSMVAVDSVTSWLMGHDPRELPALRIANERNLGENDIERIPIYLLDEKGIRRVKDYRDLKRHKLGVYVYRLRELGAKYF